MARPRKLRLMTLQATPDAGPARDATYGGDRWLQSLAAERNALSLSQAAERTGISRNRIVAKLGLVVYDCGRPRISPAHLADRLYLTRRIA
jgi:hypothetical protein